MVIGFKDGRYYKRGNFKSEPMQEHEVEAKYKEKLISSSKIEEYISNIDYELRHISDAAYLLKIAICPLLLLPDTRYFSYTDADTLIQSGRRRILLSTLNGVTFINYPNRFFVGTILFNGTMTLALNIRDLLTETDKDGISFKLVNLHRMRERIGNTIMPFISHFYKNILFKGPVLFNFTIENLKISCIEGLIMNH